MELMERAALAALFRATDGANWKNNELWNTDDELSRWYGVEVNDQGNVVKLLLSENDLKGPVPEALGDLSMLSELHLSKNKLTGAIPEALGALGELQKLRLSSNKLTGSIPEALGALTKLQILSLHTNELTGPIPGALGALSELKKLYLSNNKLIGSIPEELGGLSELQSLFLHTNELTGPIPEALGALSELKELYLSSNKLTGDIPEALGALTQLLIVYLHTNELSGCIPEALGALTKLQILCLHTNELTGSIPKPLGGLSELKELYLSINKLTGDIPEELGALRHLQILFLHTNELTGSVPKSLGALSVLAKLSLSSNKLTEIPPEVLELVTQNLLNPSLDENPWLRPPATVVESGAFRALEWWQDVDRYGEGKSNKLKMVLVGLAEAGKNTIVRHFTGGPVPERPDRTVGIEITPDWRPLNEGPLQVSIWDFAGQADYYSSHQLFLTKGALFLLVVDLRAFSEEVQSGVDNFTDRRGRIYWWLEMLNMRVPGAAIALVGSHVDQMERADADRAGTLLHTVASKYIQDKAGNALRANSLTTIDAESTRTTEVDDLGDTVQDSPLGGGPTASSSSCPSDLPLSWFRSDTEKGLASADRSPADTFARAQRSGSSKLPAKPLVLHDHVFKVTVAPESVSELREWIVKAASGQECPPGFRFPAVDQAISLAWISAYKAMDELRTTSPCVLWSVAVKSFVERMRGDSNEDFEDFGLRYNDKGGAGEGSKVLLRAMKHREAEGGVLLSLTNTSAPAATDMLHLDPTWLIELVRRLADHNLVDKNEKKQGTLKGELREYASRKCVGLAPLWDMHRTYCKSGHLDQTYLRFLWMHRENDPPGPTIVLSDPEFNSIVSTMVRLLVMYRSRDEDILVVAPRLPEYGDQRVLDPDRIEDIVVTMECSFGQVYPPPGIIGRFLAWSTKQVHSYDECWQHGAFFRYNYDQGQYKVFMYESEDEECREDQTVKFAGLTLGVQGSPAQAPKVLSELRASLEQLVADSAFGYPGLGFFMSFGEVVETRSTFLGGLRSLLDNVDDVVDRLEMVTASLEETARKLGGETDKLVEKELLAASTLQNEYPYPRLVIVVPDAEEGGAHERIQRVGWDRWTKAWESLHLPEVGLHQKFRLRFLCEHDLAEVPCGPDGRGYPIEQLKGWVKNCMPLMKASLWILRVAVGTVSNVDLPLNEVLGAAVQATGSELLDGMRTGIPGSIGRDRVPDFALGATAEQKELQGTAYDFLCEFMRKAEPTRRAVRIPCCRRSNPRVNWKDSMVQVRNRQGGWAWVLKENEKAYLAKQGAAPAAPRPPIS